MTTPRPERRTIRLLLDIIWGLAMLYVAYSGVTFDPTIDRDAERMRIQETNQEARTLSQDLNATVRDILSHDPLRAEDAHRIATLEARIDRLPNVTTEDSDYIPVRDLYAITNSVTTYADTTFKNDYNREIEKTHIRKDLDSYRTDETLRLAQIADDNSDSEHILVNIIRVGSVFVAVLGWVLLRRPREFFAHNIF